MAVRSSGYYNDPNIGAGFDNLAKAFGPPSGSDLYGYTKARTEKEKGERLAEMFNYAKDPNYKQELADRMGTAGGVYAPTQSYYAVNQNNATTLQKAGLDNTAKLDEANINNAGQLARQNALPIHVAENSTVVMPGQTAAATGLPGMFGGQVSVGQGEKVIKADGTEVQGNVKPPTDAEVKGAIISGLSPSDQRAVAMHDVGVEQVLPEGSDVPSIVFRPDAPGKRPFVKPAAGDATEITRLIAERDGLPKDDPNRAAYDARIAALGRGQKQSKYDEQTDEGLAKLNTSIFDGARGAVADQATYKTVLEAVNNPNVTQGMLGEATLAMRKTLNAFGVDAGNTGPAEMVNALGNSIALRLRSPDGGAGMPGALSDSDREFLKSMSVSLGNSSQANNLIARYYLASQQRALDLEDLRQGYVQKNGRLDEGFRTALVNYSKTNDPTAALRNQLAGMREGAAAPSGAPAAPSGAPAAPAAPAAPMAAAPDIQTVATPEQAMALPPGTQFRDDKGKLRVRP